jgi:hypothetical protein
MSENLLLSAHAQTLMGPRTVLAFRCECEHPLCSDVVALALDEYATATASCARAVVTLGHAEVDTRPVVERTDRYCTVSVSRATS